MASSTRGRRAPCSPLRASFPPPRAARGALNGSNHRLAPHHNGSKHRLAPHHNGSKRRRRDQQRRRQPAPRPARRRACRAALVIRTWSHLGLGAIWEGLKERGGREVGAIGAFTCGDALGARRDARGRPQRHVADLHSTAGFGAGGGACPGHARTRPRPKRLDNALSKRVGCALSNCLIQPPYPTA